MMMARGSEGCELIRCDDLIVENPFIEFCESGHRHGNVAVFSLFQHIPKLFRALFEHVRKFKLQLRPTFLARLYKLVHRKMSLLAGFAELALRASKLASCSRTLRVKPRREVFVPLIGVCYLLVGG